MHVILFRLCLHIGVCCVSLCSVAVTLLLLVVLGRTNIGVSFNHCSLFRVKLSAYAKWKKMNCSLQYLFYFILHIVLKVPLNPNHSYLTRADGFQLSLPKPDLCLASFSGCLMLFLSPMTGTRPRSGGGGVNLFHHLHALPPVGFVQYWWEIIVYLLWLHSFQPSSVYRR